MKIYKKDLGGPGRVLVGRWSVDPMDADIVVPRLRRRRRGLQRGGVLPMLAVALSPWAFKKKKRLRRAPRR